MSNVCICAAILLIYSQMNMMFFVVSYIYYGFVGILFEPMQGK